MGRALGAAVAAAAASFGVAAAAGSKSVAFLPASPPPSPAEAARRRCFFGANPWNFATANTGPLLRPFETPTRLRSSFVDAGGDGEGRRRTTRAALDALRYRATNAALLERLFAPDDGETSEMWTLDGTAGGGTTGLVELGLAGRGVLKVSYSGSEGREEKDDEEEKNEAEEEAEEEVPCVFLSMAAACSALRSAYESDDSASASISPQSPALPVLPLPLPAPPGPRLKLLSFAHSSEPISKSLCLTLNPLLTNRDGGLWDNIPWSSWSVDPDRRNYDAAGNPIESKYHLGKRDAYNRMMGKDWPGRSLSVTNLVAKAMYLLEGDGEDEEGEGGEAAPAFDEAAARVLARRVLELEVREARSALAETEQYLAVLKAQYGRATEAGGDGSDGGKEEERGNDSDDDDDLLWSLPDNSDRWTVQGALDDVLGARTRAEEAEAALEELASSSSSTGNAAGSSPTASVELRDVLSAFLDVLTDGQSVAPYRGAIGYAPTVDTKEDVFAKSVLPYTSPYELLLEIVREQLNADVIGTVVENTSLFEGQLVLGGAVVLRRRSRRKTVTIEGEDIEVEDEDEDYENASLRGGETYVVECDVDEAVGMALAAGVPVCAERRVWEGARIEARLSGMKEEGGGVPESIPKVEPTEDSSPLRSVSASASASASSRPRMTPVAPQTTDAFADFFRPKPPGTSVFPTDNPVTSLEQYDSLNAQDKARILLSLDSFKGRLPRPRVLREAKRARSDGGGKKSDGAERTTLDPLDRLLVPLIDESVRRRVLIRDAEARGDNAEADALRRDASKRGTAKERAEAAREAGRDEEAGKWDEEAELLETLRADVTQDEGSYSRFLDKDEWYERDWLARAKRLDKKKFGTLLDGTGLE